MIFYIAQTSSEPALEQLDIQTALILIAILVFAVSLAQLVLLIVKSIREQREKKKRRRPKKTTPPDDDDFEY